MCTFNSPHGIVRGQSFITCLGGPVPTICIATALYMEYFTQFRAKWPCSRPDKITTRNRRTVGGQYNFTRFACTVPRIPPSDERKYHKLRGRNKQFPYLSVFRFFGRRSSLLCFAEYCKYCWRERRVRS